MNIDWETFQKSYQKASPSVKDLIDSNRIPDVVAAALEKRHNSAQISAIIPIITHTILGNLSTEEAVVHLVQLGIQDAIAFMAECTNILNSTPESGSNIQALSSEIAETEKSLESLQGIRTMATDMNAVAPTSRTEHVHTSSQEEILTPKAAIGGEQRWDTDG